MSTAPAEILQLLIYMLTLNHAPMKVQPSHLRKHKELQKRLQVKIIEQKMRKQSPKMLKPRIKVVLERKKQEKLFLLLRLQRVRLYFRRESHAHARQEDTGW